MKTDVLIYCGGDSNPGKALANSIRENDGNARVTLCSADQFSGIADPRASRVIVMPTVLRHHREVLERAYGDKIDGAVRVEAPKAAPIPDALAEAIKRDDVPKPLLRAVHKGFGRWFVMNGSETISGPHSKDEAVERAHRGSTQ